jgi:hypothetical protein
MNTDPVEPQFAIVATGEPTLFDSLARLVPDERQAEYYRVLAHTRTLSPDDEMLRILEAMGILALLTRHTPKDISDERERFQEMLDLHRQFSNEAQQKMISYVHELEVRISALPGEIEAGLDPQQIAKLLGESLRQHFLQSGITATVNGLQTASAALTSAQKELSTALRTLSDSHGGVVAQVESANNRLIYSLESRAKTVDALYLAHRNPGFAHLCRTPPALVQGRFRQSTGINLLRTLLDAVTHKNVAYFMGRISTKRTPRDNESGRASSLGIAICTRRKPWHERPRKPFFFDSTMSLHVRKWRRRPSELCSTATSSRSFRSATQPGSRICRIPAFIFDRVGENTP